MAAYLFVVFGLGGAWLWWMTASRGATRVTLAVALAAATATVVILVRRRSRRLHSDHEAIPSRAITHAGAGQSRWHRAPSRRRPDPGDAEAHVGGGW